MLSNQPTNKHHLQLCVQYLPGIQVWELHSPLLLPLRRVCAGEGNENLVWRSQGVLQRQQGAGLGSMMRDEIGDPVGQSSLGLVG